MSEREAWNQVTELARERPDWLPVLKAAADEAEVSERFGGRFAGRWVLQRLGATEGQPAWRPGLRLLVGYGLLEKAGPSTRGNRRAYYRMPAWREVQRALETLTTERHHAGSPR